MENITARIFILYIKYLIFNRIHFCVLGNMKNTAQTKVKYSYPSTFTLPVNITE